MAAAIAVGSPACSARPEACSGMWGHKYAKKSAAEAAPQKWVVSKNHKVETEDTEKDIMNGIAFLPSVSSVDSVVK